MTVLACRDLEVRFGSFKALDGVSIGIEEGECVGLIGASGAGKSTLAKVLLGLVRPDRGVVVHGGRELDLRDRRAVDALRRAVQPVFQDPSLALDPRYTAVSAVAEPLRIRGESKAPAYARARDFLTRVGLAAEHASAYPHQLSGGQRQRVCIARALVTEPAVLLLDEPVSALDVSVQAQILNLLRSLSEELGTSYLFIAHDLPAVDFLCDKTLVMDRGRIVEILPRGALHAAEHPVTRELVAAVPTLGNPVSSRSVEADRA